MKHKKFSMAFFSGMILLLAGTSSLMIAAMGQIKEKMNVSANTTLLNSTRMISDSLLNNFSSDQQQLETCANLFSRKPSSGRWRNMRTRRHFSVFILSGMTEQAGIPPGIR